MPTCSHSKQTFRPFWVRRIGYATPWSQPATAESSAGPSPDTPKTSTRPVPAPKAAPAPAGVCRVEGQGRQLAIRIWREEQKDAVLCPLELLLATLQPLSSDSLHGAHPFPPPLVPSPTQSSGKGGVSPRSAVPARAPRTYSHSGVSAGSAALRGASCVTPGALPGRAPRGSPRWPGWRAPRPRRRARIPPLAALAWPLRAGRLAPAVLPRQRPLQPPRADTRAKVNSCPSLPRPPRRRLPLQVSFLLQPGPVIHRGGRARRAQRPLPPAGRSAGPRGPAPARV